MKKYTCIQTGLPLAAFSDTPFEGCIDTQTTLHYPCGVAVRHLLPRIREEFPPFRYSRMDYSVWITGNKYAMEEDGYYTLSDFISKCRNKVSAVFRDDFDEMLELWVLSGYWLSNDAIIAIAKSVDVYFRSYSHTTSVAHEAIIMFCRNAIRMQAGFLDSDYTRIAAAMEVLADMERDKVMEALERLKEFSGVPESH